MPEHLKTFYGHNDEPWVDSRLLGHDQACIDSGYPVDEPHWHLGGLAFQRIPALGTE